MKAIIIAGGRGERLRPITEDIPKPMVEVAGKPILWHIINLFKKQGIRDFIIALCYLPKVITDYFGNGTKFGVRIKYTYENPRKPLGTAGAISFSKNLIFDTFVVTYADILRDLNIKKMIGFHKKKKAFATLNVYKRASKDAKSMVILDENSRITKFIERPEDRELKKDHIWANGSFYILEPEIFKFIPKDKKIDFGKDLFPEIIASKKVYAFTTNGYFADIGNLRKLELARKTFNIVE